MKIIIAVNYFGENAPWFWIWVLNIPGVWIHQGFEYARVLNTLRLWICFWYWIYQGSKYARALNIQGSNTPGFWICQDSEYTTALNMLLVLNIPGFLMCQGYKGFWICLWISLFMLKYVWICQNMHDIPTSSWIAFIF